MSRKTHGEILFYNGTGYSYTACGRVIRRCDTSKDPKLIDCKSCLKKLKKTQNVSPD